MQTTTPKTIKIVLVGQPNVGKSMLINAISNANMHVGNFTGVTVEKLEASLFFDGYKIEIVDLPGTYSLNDYSPDEKVTKDYLLNEEYDVIVNVVDSTNLKKNLLLTTELLELHKKMVVALNMSDEAEKENIIIDKELLSQILGVPCIRVSAAKKFGKKKLLQSIILVYEQKNFSPKLVFSDEIEEEIINIVEFLKERNYKHAKNYRELAILLLKEDSNLYKTMHDEPIWIELLPLLRNALDHIYTHHNTKDIEDIFAQERYAFASGAFRETVKQKEKEEKDLTEKLDSILIHKYFGIPIFLFFMWGLFQLTFEVGAVPMEYIDSFFGWLGDLVKTYSPNEAIASLIGDGIIGGVGAVILFLPNIMILFLGIALLEGTGYMSRVSFMLDGFFHKFGLHGKSFIPLVTGFGCSVPAYMAARTLQNKTDRLITLFIIGFMSCGARLPVYVLFISAFFPQEYSGNILFLIYISGALLGLVAAKFLRMFIFKGSEEPFVMEMPKYRMPSIKLLWHTVYSKSLSYLKKAGTFILAASVLIWFASNYPKNLDIQKDFEAKISKSIDEEKKKSLQQELQKKLLENSYLGMTGKATQWIFEPIGLNWQLTVALESGLAAKEVVVSTLGVLYSLGEDVDEENSSLLNAIRKNIPFASAVSFIIFVMIYLPCLAASMVFMREAGGVRYLVYLFAFTTIVAYVMAFIGYKIATLV